ncbi:NAD-dependent epimerase/dehydratase family protein [bacterium]|nr:NAD-dependent epimerase/dehydratase family protein [bacterium]
MSFDSERPVFVTGGGGFLGGHLVRQLLDAGRSVVVIERPGFDQAKLPAEVEGRHADIRDAGAVRAALADCRDAEVYHLAANPHLWARDRAEFEAVNHQGARHVIDIALEHRASRVLHCSTESILTKRIWPKGVAIDEQVAIDESDAVGPYCLSKLRAEKYAIELGRQGLPVVVANPTMPIGPDDPGPSPPTCLILDFLMRRMPGYMDCSLNLVDSRDVATGLIRVMELGHPGRRHLLAGENVSLAGLLDRIAALTGLNAPKIRIPYAVGLSYAYLSEWVADYWTGNRPMATVTGLRLARRIMHFDDSSTRSLIEWRARPLGESLDDTLTWIYRSGRFPRVSRTAIRID